MAGIDETSIAEVYARALLDLATQEGIAESIDQQFSEFAAYFKLEPDFRAFITSRVIDASARRESLDRMLKGRMNDILLNTLQVLNERNRLYLIAYVQQQYHELFLEQQNIVEAHATTAEPLSDDQRELLQRMLEERTSAKVTLLEHVNPEILGGVLIRIGDEQIDMSVSRQLEHFRRALIEHASRHIHAGTDLFEGATEF